MIVKSYGEMENRVRSASSGDVFLVSGEEFYQSFRLLSRVRHRAGELDFEIHRLTPEDLGDVNLPSVFSEGSLFSPGKLIIIDRFDKMPKGEKSFLGQAVEQNSENIIFLRTAGRKPSNALIRAIEKKGTGFTCWEPFQGQMWKWTEKLAREEGISFTRDGGQAAEAIASGRLERLAEITARVALFHGSGTRASAEDVYRAVKGSRETTAFQFCEAVLRCRKAEAMVSLSLLIRSGEEPIRLLALLYSQWKQVASAGELLKSGLSPVAAAGKLGIPQFRWKAVEALARKGRYNATSSALEAFASADQSLKRGGDPLVSLGAVVLTLTTA